MGGAEVATSDDEVLRSIVRHLDETLPRRKLRVVDAGCGRSSALPIPREVEITGIDLDEDALKARVQAGKDLDHAILGDVRDCGLVAPGSADLVISRYVLEHVSNVERAFANLARWVAPGGLVVVQIPDRQSAYGYVARRTPHRLHVWYYRRVLGRPHAGEPGRHPYRVMHEPAISRGGIRALCERHGLVLRCEYVVDELALRRGPQWTLIRTGLSLLGRLSGNRLTTRHNNLAYVLQRPAAPPRGTGR
jgi:SAM-dependent methyltransferase